ncbi:MAG: 30S ribosomal protein S20 [Alphaproteobacteria bacterium]|nr:30S ribosomal protein S20 [Alphaproteobacteria bacterium]
MANIQSAKKRARQTIKRQARNRAQMHRLRTFVHYCEQALQSGDATKAAETFRNATSELHSAAQKGLLHKTTASRKISRLSRRVKALSA